MVLFPAPASPSIATTMRFCVVSAKNQNNKWCGPRSGNQGLERIPCYLATGLPVVQFFGVFPTGCGFESCLGSQFLGRQKVYFPTGLRDRWQKGRAAVRSVEVERRLQCFFHDPQDFGRQRADPLGELCAIQRGHLMAYGKACLRQPGGATRDFEDGESALALRCRSRYRDYDG